MKLKLYYKNSEWHSGIYRGNGGVSSLVVCRQSRSILRAIGIFLKWDNIRKGYEKTT